MKANIQVVENRQAAAASPPVFYHDRIEDFTVYQSGGFLLRWYALTLDLTFVAPVHMLINLPFRRYLELQAALGHSGRHLALLAFLNAIPLTLYFVVPTMLWGRTFGKRIIGLRVVRGNFKPQLSFGRVLLRETVGKFLSGASFGIGFLLAVFTKRHRALHDYLSDTVVISYRER